MNKYVLLATLISLHYLSANFYTTYCVHWSITGFLNTPFLFDSMHCKISRWIFIESYNYIHSFWLLLASYTITKIVEFITKIEPNFKN
jgi:hypothetical protein